MTTQQVYLWTSGVLLAVGMAGVWLLWHVGDTLTGQAFAEAVALSIATAIMSTGIIGFSNWLWLIHTEERSMNAEHIAKMGLAWVYSGRAATIRKEYEDRLDKVQSKIDVLGFGLRAFREDFGKNFAQWSNKAQVRILLIDPEYPSLECSYANERDREEKSEEGGISRDVKAFIRECERLTSENANFQIRLYRCTPAINIFRIDDALFWGPYIIEQVSRNTPTLLVKSPSSLFSVFSDHFETIWRSSEFSRSIPTEWIDDSD